MLAIAVSITIARNLREQTQVAAELFDSADKSEQLAAMASDLDIQAELATINKEFAVAEMDFKVNLSGVAD